MLGVGSQHRAAPGAIQNYVRWHACSCTLARRRPAFRKPCAYNYNDWGPYNEKHTTDNAANRAFIDALEGKPSDLWLDFERTYRQHRRRQAILPLDLYQQPEDDSSTTQQLDSNSHSHPSSVHDEADDITSPHHGSDSCTDSSGGSFWAYLQYHQHMALPDDQLDLLKAAVLIARHAFPDVSEDACRQGVREIAQQVQRRLPAGQRQSVLAVVQALRAVMFQELGFTGNVDDYYQPHNSCINWGLEHRTGSPALLVLIYLLVASELGLQATPVLLPSHTFVAPHADAGSSPLLVDPFNGGQVCSLSVTEARLNTNWGFHSPLLHLGGELQALAASSRPQWSSRQLLCRLLANLREAYWAPLPKSGQLRWRLYSDDQLHHQCAMLHRALAVVRYQRASEPRCARHLRDEGLTLACMGRGGEGVALLRQYLQASPDAADRAAVEQAIEACGRGGAGWP